MVAHAFSAKRRDPNFGPHPGILLADGVGVGKTAQVMGFIAFLQSVYHAQKLGGMPPPIIGEVLPSRHLEEL